MLNRRAIFDDLLCQNYRAGLEEGDSISFEAIWPTEKQKQPHRSDTKEAFQKHGLNLLDLDELRKLSIEHNILES